MEMSVDMEERAGLDLEIAEAAGRVQLEAEENRSGDEWVDHSDISDIE